MDKDTFKRSPLALAVLALLMEDAMHPYRMQQLFKHRGKDEVINVKQRNSLYQAVERLLRAQLIQVREIRRIGLTPDRTIYEITDAGRTVCHQWMCDMLSSPRPEFTEFPVAIAFLPLLTPPEVEHELSLRLKALDAVIERHEALCTEAGYLPRLFLLETDYMRAMAVAERAWVHDVREDLRAGRIAWSTEELKQLAARSNP